MKKAIMYVTLVALVSFVMTPLISAEITPKDSKELGKPTRVIMIKPGQTLADLAQEYFGDRKQYKQFLEYNVITDINSVRPGDMIRVPVLPSAELQDQDFQSATSVLASNIIHKRVNDVTEIVTVQVGETLADLAQKYFGDRGKYKKFLEYNDIANLNTIKAGDQLQVPISGNVATSTKQPEPQEPTQSSSSPKVETKLDETKAATPVKVESSVQKDVEPTDNILKEIREIRQVLRNLGSAGLVEEELEETAEELAPPTGVRVFDVPNDAGKGLSTKGAVSKFKGGNIIVTWAESSSGAVTGYHVFRKQLPDGDFEQITKKAVKAGETKKNVLAILPSYDREFSPDYTSLGFYADKATTDVPYVYKVAAVGEAGIISESSESEEIKAVGNLFATTKISELLGLILVAAVTLYFIDKAQSGQDMFIRRIPALDAFEEAIGRSAEMGRPVMFIPGNDDVYKSSSIAAINIFEGAANYAVVMQSHIMSPNQQAVVNQVLSNSLRNIFLYAGRPDLYDEYDVHFETTDQLAYASAVAGSMHRENPAAIFIQGDFGAESLIYAENGNAVGAIQIAGTDNEKQLPYFVVACDYTLLGEELYAAGAYIKKDPIQICTLKAQDVLKLAVFACLIIGSLLALSGSSNIILDFFTQRWFEVIS
ncbi:TPA: LysM domain-containing protein [Candidatus Poribacteria bacterium]|nr:LysM domain-containing protein [Candidatus Poribacteria bacterium]HIO49239.1 LysM domain-containing protein [Candidatus Poribacteria bacterium]